MADAELIELYDKPIQFNKVSYTNPKDLLAAVERAQDQGSAGWWKRVKVVMDGIFVR